MEAPFRRDAGAPSAAMISASLIDAVLGLSDSRARELGADLAEGPAFDQAHGGERLVAAHHLVEQAIGVVPAPIS